MGDRSQVTGSGFQVAGQTSLGIAAILHPPSSILEPRSSIFFPCPL